MGSLMLVVTYVCAIVFAVAVAVKFMRYVKMPMHLRWELYPVPHEGKRAIYGGSILEETDWYKIPREVDKVNELKVMLPEMILLKALWEHNRSLWWRSFPFHFGLYNMIACMALITIGAIAQLAGIQVAKDSMPGMIIFYPTAALGFFGMGMCLLGSLGLLQRRLMDEELTDYTGGADIFNLVFIGAVAALLLACAARNPGFEPFRAYVRAVITFNFKYAPANALPGISFLLASLLIAYIPLTHMAHFFIKWFTYHKIRWEDEPNMPGSHFEATIAEYLQYPVSWGAPHINPDGKTRTWADVATTDVNTLKEDK